MRVLDGELDDVIKDVLNMETLSLTALERFIEKVTQMERERCAKIAEKIGAKMGYECAAVAGPEIAAAIRKEPK